MSSRPNVNECTPLAWALPPPPPAAFCEMASARRKLPPKLVQKSATSPTLLYRKLPVKPATLGRFVG